MLVDEVHYEIIFFSAFTRYSRHDSSLVALLDLFIAQHLPDWRSGKEFYNFVNDRYIL